MARWVAMIHAGAALSSTGLVGLAGIVVGICAMVMVISLCTLSERDNRVGNKESSDGDDSPTFSKSPKKWINNLSSKRLLSMKKGKPAAVEESLAAYDRDFTEGNGLDSPVWQRTILMGERCQPPVFSGLILYDDRGNRVQDFPAKSPRAAAIPPPILVTA